MQESLDPRQLEEKLQDPEAIRELNKGIAQRIKDLLGDTNRKVYTSVHDRSIDIELSEDAKGLRFNPFHMIPGNFEPPFYLFNLYSNRTDPVLVCSPYKEGLVPDYCLAPDNNIYNMMNLFIFTLAGEVALGFDVDNLSRADEDIPEDQEDPIDLSKLNLPKVDFVPLEIDAGLLPMGVREYRRVLLHLGLIETGQFKESPKK